MTASRLNLALDSGATRLPPREPSSCSARARAMTCRPCRATGWSRCRASAPTMTHFAARGYVTATGVPGGSGCAAVVILPRSKAEARALVPPRPRSRRAGRADRHGRAEDRRDRRDAPDIRARVDLGRRRWPRRMASSPSSPPRPAAFADWRPRRRDSRRAGSSRTPACSRPTGSTGLGPAGRGPARQAAAPRRRSGGRLGLPRRRSCARGRRGIWTWSRPTHRAGLRRANITDPRAVPLGRRAPFPPGAPAMRW
jgi:hypothetical protein